MRDAHPNRRTFVKQSTAAVATASAFTGLNVIPNAHADGSDSIKVGLVGCGGRGTGAAEQALTADTGNRLVAMADAFPDRLESSLGELERSAVKGQLDVPEDRRYSGFDAYKDVIDQVDVVLLATPPGFRPIHFAYAVEKGIHAFVEKPMAVDGPGLRKFLDAAKLSREKGLSAVHGFCWRYHQPRVETMEKVFEGAIGPIRAIETTYNSQGVWDPRKTREECGSDMEYQMRNWYYYCWLSGDHIVEQAIHGIDTINWAMQGKPPIRCWGQGGRTTRTDPKYGNIWDNFSIVYEYPDDVRGYHHCRHWHNTASQVKDYVIGAEGIADVFGTRIDGPNRWRSRTPSDNMYQAEHDKMYQALRAGAPLNNMEEAADSTRLGIMGRMAAYTGAVVSWEDALNSKESLVPETFTWGDAPQQPIPVPGITKFF